MDRKELVRLCHQAKHMLYIQGNTFILKNIVTANKLTYTSEAQVIEFCNKTINSWKARK